MDGPPPNTLPPTPPNKQIQDFKSTTTKNTSVSWSRGQCWSSGWARRYLRGLLETKCSLRSCLPLLSCTAVMAALQKKHSRLLNSCRLMQVLRERKQRGQGYRQGCNCLTEERGNIYTYAPTVLFSKKIICVCVCVRVCACMWACVFCVHVLGHDQEGISTVDLSGGKRKWSSGSLIISISGQF